MNRGTRIANAYIGITADGSGINEEIVDSVDDAGKDIDKKGDEHGESYGVHFGETMRDTLNKAGDKAGVELNKRMSASGDDAGRDYGNNFEKSLRRMANRIGGRVGDRIGEAMSERLESSFSELIDVFEARLSTLNVSGNRGTRSTGGTDNDVFGDKIGALLGAGSRNNFLNLFGKSLGGIAGLVEKVAMGAKNMFSTFSKGFSEAAEGATLLQKIGAGFGGGGAAIGEGFASIAASGPAAVLAIGAVAAAMVVLVSVANALLAILAALVSTIVSALVGALAVGAAGFAALGAAAGLATLAFMSMTDAQKDLLSKAFKPLHEEAIGLGQVMLRKMVPAFDAWSKNLQVALALAKPLADVMGGALAKAGKIFTSSLSGSGVQLFFSALTQTLPGIVRNLSRALGGFINGFAGMFAAILPDVLRFARYLSDIAQEFAAWATSARGQNAITSFVDRALASLRSLWSFLGAVGGLLSTVFFGSAAQNAGNSIFDSMTRAVRRFTDYISQEGRMQRWFQTGVTFAKTLGTVIGLVGKALIALNQSGVISGISKIVDFGAKAIGWFSRLPRIVRDVMVPILALTDLIKVLKDVGERLHLSDYFTPAIAAIAGGVEAIQIMIDAIGRLAGAITSAFSAVPGAIAVAFPVLGQLASQIGEVAGRLGQLLAIAKAGVDAVLPGGGSGPTKGYGTIPGTIGGTSQPGAASGTGSSGQGSVGTGGQASQELQNLINSLSNIGSGALGGTSVGSGGTAGGGGGGGGTKKFHNPYVQWALSLIKNGPTISAQIKNALLSVNRQVAAAIRSASESTDSGQVRSALMTMMENIKASATSTVNLARDALNSAAESLASATSKASMQRALRAVKQAQKDLSAALKNQKRIEAVAKTLGKQRIVTERNVERLLDGLKVQNATLADFAAARNRLAIQIQKANQKLSDAIQLRNNYRTQVSESIKAFAALTTAQAQTIDGVEQALTHSDITTNLEARLAKIREFQSNLKILLAQGLSNAAYQQIVDAGVETGSAFAAALIEGGTGAVGNVNELVSQINSTADALGLQASDRLYQAGVNAAQGLVDGLNSLSAQLTSAATKLGNAIATALKNALGIKSPSKVAYDMMDYVGDGAADGLDNQHAKVGRASSRLAAKIAVSPEVASWSARQGTSPTVSGNDQRPIELTINTPTTDPHAVAMETINELTGRL